MTMAIITLTSDYGYSDPYLASVKGALLSELPELRLIDISHAVEPGDFFQAAFVLRNSYSSFPKGTVHLIAVSEISESGKVLAAEIDGSFFICADNGLISMINPDIKIGKVLEVDFRQEISLFPARDVMVKAACHIARGGSIDLLGRATTNFRQSTIMRPRISNEGSVILGSVVYIDNFGNLITNISKKTFREVGKDRSFKIMLSRGQSISKIQDNYYPASQGSLLGVFNSLGLLEIAMMGARGKEYNGANTLLGMNVRDNVTISFK